MANARVPGTVDSTRHPQQVKDGTLALQESGVPRSIGVDGRVSQPAGSIIRFGRVGGKDVFWEYENGKPRKPSIRLCLKKSSGDYYQEGDFFGEGEFEARTLKQMFPEAGIETKDFNMWDVLSSLAGLHETEKFKLLRRLDGIIADPADPWRGTVSASFYIVVDKALVPLSGRNTTQRLTARPGAGSLNDYFALLPALKQMEFLKTVIEGEIAIISEIAQDALIGTATKAAKGARIVQKLAKAKYVAKAAMALEKLSKLVDAKMLRRASAAFAKEFAKSISKEIAKYSLQELSGKQAKMSIGPDQSVAAVGFEEGSAISPNQDASQGTIGKPFVPLGKPPKIDFTQAILNASAAFAHSILIVDALAKPISEAMTKKVGNKEMQEAVRDYLKEFIGKLGEDLFTGAIATAAGKAIEDPNGAKSYPDHLQKELTEKLIGRFTKDVVSGVLNAAAFGFKD